MKGHSDKNGNPSGATAGLSSSGGPSGGVTHTAGQASSGTRLPQDFHLHYDQLGRLVLTDADGRQHEDVEPIRSFPIGEPERRISICDREGHEIRWIEQLSDLPAETRAIVELDLSRREFIPIVLRIVRMEAFAEPSQWEVETDRGRTQFLLGNEEDVHRLEGGRALIVDTKGIRYLIPDPTKLDPHSRRILERYF